MKIGLVTDSTADLSMDILEKYGIEVIPAMVVIDGKQYADGRGLSRETFYTQLPSMKKPPTTAAPSVGEILAAYQRLFDRGCDHIISIHAAGLLTTIVNSARLAAAELGGRVTVLDSGSLSLGVGFQVLAAAEAIEEGQPVETVLSAIQSTRQRLNIFAALDTMEYLRRSGRIPRTVAALGGLLSIKPVVELREGEVKPITAARTTQQGNQRILDLLLGLGPLERLVILHTNAPRRAQWLVDQLVMRSVKDIPREISWINVTTVIGTHVGPNGLGIAAIKK